MVYSIRGHVRIVKFLISGGSAAVVEYSVFLLLEKIEITILIANSISFICGLMVSFLLNKLWVFANKDNGKQQFKRYLVLAGINLGLSNILVLLLTNVVELKSVIAKLIVMICVAVWNYIIFSKLIFISK